LNIVFDFGGVLFDWLPHEFVARLLPGRAPTPEAAQALVAEFFEGYGGDWCEFDRGTLAVGALAGRIARRTGLSLAEVHKVVDAVPHELRPIADMVALLPRLQARGHALYFLSNMPAPYADQLEATHGFIGRFRAGVFSGRVQLVKPEPAIYAHAQRAFGIEAAQTLFIDDVARNAEAARRAGWQALEFKDPAQCARDLARRGLLDPGRG
jgi:putative hydrolase of the HAD superfamily